MTKEELDKKEQTLYKYKVSSFDIMLPEGTKTIKGNFINSIVMEKDFDNLFFPILRIEFVTDPLTRASIVENKKTVKFRLRVQKYLDTPKGPQQITDLFNAIFAAFITENAPMFSKEEYEKSKIVMSGNKDAVTPMEASTTMELYLFREDHLNNTKKVHNAIYSGLNLTDAICLLFKKAGFGGKSLLMSPLDNTRTFSEMVLPPLPMLGSIKFLEEQYDGFYDEGTVLFFDIDIAYLLRRSPSCDCFKTQEFKQTVLMVRDKKDMQVNKLLSVKDGKEKRYYQYLYPDAITFDSISMASDQVYGEKILLIDPTTGTKTEITPGGDIRGEGNCKIMFNNYGNSRLAKNLQTEIREKSCVVNAQLSNFDLEAFTPNKEFVLKFDDLPKASQYNGSYRLSAINYMLFKNADESFSITGSIKLKK